MIEEENKNGFSGRDSALYGITLPPSVFGKTKTGLIKIREQHEFFNITDAIALGLYYFLMEEKTLVSLS